MAQSIEVNLPRSHRAEFPNRCVVCDRCEPGSYVRIITRSVSWWTWVWWWWGKPFVAKAPACRGCAWKLHAMRFLGLASMVVTLVAAFWWIWPLLKDSVPRGLRRWAMLGLGLGCLMPQLLLEVFYAKPFQLTAHSDSVDYEFTSFGYAVDFATMNLDAAWVKVNGDDIKNS